MIPRPRAILTYCQRWLKGSEHDEGIDVAEGWMSERQREASDDLEAERLPQTHGSVVGAHDEIELHRPVSSPSGVVQRVLAHATRHTPSESGRAGDVATIAYVSAAAGLIWANVVRPENCPTLLDDERLLVRAQ